MKPRSRVIVDNDFAGDPDDLVQLSHHLLSPSVEVPFVIGSHLPAGGDFVAEGDQAARAVEVVRELLAIMGREELPVFRGSETALPDATTPAPSEASAAIIREALRDDTVLPLFYVAGGGLTDLASALLAEPRIAERLTLVWIGGDEHEGLGLPFPNPGQTEYNLSIDVAAAQAVFGTSAVPIWQVPRDAYRQVLASMSELEVRMGSQGRLGRHLVDSLRGIVDMVETTMGWSMGETYCLGDSPLVLLTALQSAFEPDTSSSSFVVRPTPEIAADGRYLAKPDGRPMRVYTRIDTRLLLEDLYAKLALFAAQHG